MDKGTQKYYNANAATYANDTLGINMSGIRNRFLGYLGSGSTILDVGCGSGRDLIAFSDAGHTATGVDGAKELCAIARQNSNCQVENAIFENFTPAHQFDGIWAMASLVHTPEAQLPAVLMRVWSWLKPGGVFFACLKEQSAAGTTSEGVLYNGFSLPEVESMFQNLQGSHILEAWSSAGKRGAVTWQNVIVRKSANC